MATAVVLPRVAEADACYAIIDRDEGKLSSDDLCKDQQTTLVIPPVPARLLDRCVF